MNLFNVLYITHLPRPQEEQELLLEKVALGGGEGVIEEFDGVAVMATFWPTSLGIIEPATERLQ